MISLICKKYGIENYTINDDGSIDVAGDVSFYSKGLTELPLRFNKVTGYFTCSCNQLTSLKGSPKWIDGNFTCNNNQLTSLEFSPDYVGGDFYCTGNKLTSLEFSPDYVGGYFSCRYNDLIDNYCDTEFNGGFHTSLKQDGLIFDGNRVTNYDRWRKLYKRKQILNQIFDI